MNYNDCVNFINDSHKFGSKKGLYSIKLLLEKLGNPQDKLKFIHIAGTNGKGSVCSYLSSILSSANYKVGEFISPYLQKINERFQINSVPIDDYNFTKITNRVKDACDDLYEIEGFYPTSFEIVLAIGMIYFLDENCDLVILEAGIGGRLDATNIIKNSLASIITTISYDHESILGNTLEEIAYQKAGIIKSNSLCITLKHNQAIDNIINKEALEKNTKVYFVSDADIDVIKLNYNGSIFNYREECFSLNDIHLNMIGKHQIINCALAIKTIILLRENDYIRITDLEIKQGVSKAFWPGRIELIKEKPYIIIDGAHNSEGINSLKETIKLFDYNKLIILIATMKDKDYSNIVKTAYDICDTLILTEIDYYRATPTEEMSKIIGTKNNIIEIKNSDKAIETAINLACNDDLVLLCGSLYFVGAAKDYFEKSF
ncbi:MAG: folylpolyglutamate synthase/dihydrofolate synthase family protein [Tissierellia bacterium]|nr:folylpolyglutamate synthase/dihydrofolate synthase family protein [Tissierellia bacterium]